MSHLARRPLSRNSNSERLPDGCKSRSFDRFDVDVAVQSLDKGVQSSFCCGLFSSCKGHFSKPCCLQGLGASCEWCSCFLPRLWRADFQSGWPWVIPSCSTMTAVAIQCSPLVCCFFDEMMDIGWSCKSKIVFSLIDGNQMIFWGDLLLFLRAPLHIQSENYSISFERGWFSSRADVSRSENKGEKSTSVRLTWIEFRAK